MKLNFTIIYFIMLFPFSAKAEWESVNKTHLGLDRQYLVNTGPNYDGSQPATLVFFLHGLGGAKEDVMNSNLSSIIETENIIVIAPDAINYSNPLGDFGKAWNAGIVINTGSLGVFEVNSDIDDVSFILSIVEDIKSNYNIHNEKVFAAGFSMGGFMVQRLACEANNIFKAIASVAGTRAIALSSCNLEQMIPIAHFHGTADDVVKLNGNVPFPVIGDMAVGISVDSLLNFWKISLGTNTIPVTEITTDDNMDGLFLTHQIFTNETQTLEYFKVENGVHNWYGFENTENEFDYATLIWDFFNRSYTSSITSNMIAKVKIFPNPSNQYLNITSSDMEIQQVEIYALDGTLTITSYISSNIDIQHLADGIYFLKIKDKRGNIYPSKFVKK